MLIFWFRYIKGVRCIRQLLTMRRFSIAQYYRVLFSEHFYFRDHRNDFNVAWDGSFSCQKKVMTLRKRKKKYFGVRFCVLGSRNWQFFSKGPSIKDFRILNDIFDSFSPVRIFFWKCTLLPDHRSPKKWASLMDDPSVQHLNTSFI